MEELENGRAMTPESTQSRQLLLSKLTNACTQIVLLFLKEGWKLSVTQLL